ncbi:MAG: glycosyl transferase family 1 [Acidobacteriia bacterium]|nr:glycosyl transferase family 1 [Terriglobia bacterium]
MTRKRILFLAEGATMAHFTRPLVLAEALDRRRYDIFFYAPSRFSAYLSDKPFATGELETMPGEQFLANLSKGAPLFPPDIVRRYVKQDQDLISSIRPDLIVGDLRLSLPISASLESTACAVITNAYWSPHAKHRAIIPALPLTRVVPPRLLVPVYKLAEPLAHAVHVGQLNTVRKEFGLPPIPLDARAMFTEGTYVLYADVPEFVPTHNLPGNHHYMGICQWTPPTPKPDWWDRMTADGKPKVFVALGSSGSLRVLPALLAALSRLPVSLLVATSGRPMPPTTSEAYVAELLPLSETTEKSSVVVCHGGSSGCYPAIASGTPVLGIPSNADQQLATAVLEESGAGLGVRVEEASEKRLFRTLEKLLFTPQYRQAAQKWATVFKRYDSGALFRQFVNETLGE